MNQQQEIWTRLTQGAQPNPWLNLAMSRVARALSDVVGEPIRHGALRIGTVPVPEIARRAGDPKEKAAGVRLEIHGDAKGQALLLLPWPSALRLMDFLMEVPPGTTTDIRFAERTALAEVGNLALAHFLNAVVASEQMPHRLQPTSPSVLIDTLEKVLQLALMSVTIRGNDPLIIETVFEDTMRAIQIRFWVLPDQAQRPRPHAGPAMAGPRRRGV